MKEFIEVLADLANELDNNQAHRMADKITNQIKTASEDYDHEYDMVRNEMETAKRAIDGIEDVVGDEGEGNLMAWVQSKISNAVQMLKGVSDYLVSNEEISVDVDALVASTKTGAYVHCWVWVENAVKPRRTRKKTV